MTNPFDTPPPAPARRSFPTKIVAIIAAVILALVAIGAVISFQNKRPSNCTLEAITGVELTEDELQALGSDPLAYCDGTWALVTMADFSGLAAWTGEKWIPYDRNQISFRSRDYTCFREEGMRDDGVPDDVIAQLPLCTAEEESNWSR